MRAGRLEQLGPPTDVYSRPAMPLVAEFVGLNNRLRGEVRDGEVEVRGVRLPLVRTVAPARPAVALVRPEAVSLVAEGDGGGAAFVGTVIATAFLAQMPTADAATHPA